MKIWKRVYRDYGYSVVELDISNFVLETYNESEIKDNAGVSYKVTGNIIDNNEMVIIIE